MCFAIFPFFFYVFISTQRTENRAKPKHRGNVAIRIRIDPLILGRFNLIIYRYIFYIQIDAKQTKLNRKEKEEDV
jgi:hypothetical protein